MNTKFKFEKIFLLSIVILFTLKSSLNAQGFKGYYQYPDIYKNTIFFTAEGDIWKVDIKGGLAQR